MPEILTHQVLFGKLRKAWLSLIDSYGSAVGRWVPGMSCPVFCRKTPCDKLDLGGW